MKNDDLIDFNRQMIKLARNLLREDPKLAHEKLGIDDETMHSLGQMSEQDVEELCNCNVTLFKAQFEETSGDFANRDDVADINQQFLFMARDLAKSDTAEACARLSIGVESCKKISGMTLSQLKNFAQEKLRFKPLFDSKTLERMVHAQVAGLRSALILVQNVNRTLA